jgi:8-oxo-dGTP pyrophosphatase MutT (NUDIX family)
MTLEEVAAAFEARIGALTPLSDGEVQWPAMRLRVRAYLQPLELPPELVTSARAVVFKGRKVVVVRDAHGNSHIQPGGGIEPGENEEQALRRELLEEIGWHVGPLTRFGFLHLRPLGEPIANPRYRWGDFVNPLYVAEAERYEAKARDRTQIEVGSRLTPIRRARAELDPSRIPLLDAALAARRF